jgi:acyl dehydratase
MTGLYFEEFEVGRVFKHAITRTVTEMDNTLFSCLTLNVQPLHLDHHFSAKTEWGKPLVNSLFTLGLMIGISVADTTLGTTIGISRRYHSRDDGNRGGARKRVAAGRRYRRVPAPRL